MGTILLGSLPGVWIGTHLVPIVPVAALRTTLGAILAAASLGVFSKAGANIPAVAIIGVPLLIGAAAFVILRRRAPLLRGPTSDPV